MSALPIINSDSIDHVTLLRADPGKRATKLWTKDTIENYDAGWKFTSKSVPVNSIRNLSKLLKKIETDPRTFIIRGQPIPLSELEGVVPLGKDSPIIAGPNQVKRWNEAFRDEPLHFALLDVDGFTPSEGIDPVLNPEAAVLNYVERVLPEPFQGVSCHWQLSSSAGSPANRGVLKAHVWFWLKTPYASPVLKEWAKQFGKKVDKTVFHSVQVHYTANPQFDEGLTDPVPVRSGIYEGWLADEVDLVIDEVTILRAEESVRNKKEGRDLKDPKEKKGPIGAFHRAFSMTELLNGVLADHFEPGSQSHRLTWSGGNSPEGAFITDDEEHIVITNNTSPLEGPVNKFDLVRHFVYGHLDEGIDPFEIHDMVDKPSYQTAMAYIESLPEVQTELQRELTEAHVAARSLRDNLMAQITEADTETALRESVCLAIRSSFSKLHKVDLDMLARALQNRLNDLTSIKPTVSAVRELITPIRREIDRSHGLPDWAYGYFYVSNLAKLFRYDSDEWLSRESFDFKHNPDAGVDEDGFQISAYNLLRDNPLTPRVEKAIYMPHLGHTFELDGDLCVNRYRPSSTPVAKPVAEWTEKDHRAVKLVKRHFEILCSERKAVTEELLDWLAYCVKFPGIKMRYSWLIWGGEGAGKTWIGKLMASVLGGPNVKLVAVRDVLNDTFNSWADGAVLSVIEEIRITGHRKDAWDNLKEPLTNDKLTITKKGLDPYQAPNVTNYIMFSNHFDAVPISLGSRRVAVIEVPFNGDNTQQQLNEMAIREGFASQTDYFDALFDCVAMHGPALRTWFLDRMFSEGFNPQGWAPATEEREAMAFAGISEEEDLARAAIERGSFWVSDKVVNPGNLRTAMSLWEDGPVPLRNESIPFILSKLGYKKYKNRIKIDGKSVRVWTKNIPLAGCVNTDNEAIRNELKRTESAGTRSEEAGTQDDEDGFLR